MKKLIISVLTVTLLFNLGSCNKSIVDTTYTFNKAIINLGEEYITIDVKSWADYQDSNQIRVTSTEGTVYLVHSSNITLIKEN